MELTVQERNVFGKKVNALRRQGLLPAELYGRGVENLHLAVDAKEFNRVLREAGESTVVYLAIGGAKKPVLIHEVERNFLSGEVAHVDFYEVRMDEKIKARVAIELTGDAPAVKEGGVLNQAMAEIEVEALPADLPHSITVDVSSLVTVDQSIYVRDIAVPEKVKVLVEPETVVVSVTPPRKEEEKAPAPAVDVSQVAVESEEKKAEREGAKSETEEKGTGA